MNELLDLSAYIKILTGLIAVLNPVGAVPIFISLTDEHDDIDRRQTARVTAFTVAIVLIVVTFTGKALLNFFGISIASFQVGGGILILLMAISMMNAKQPGSKNIAEETSEALNRSSLAVVPMAIPILTGPGTISTMILYSDQSNHFQHHLILASFGILMGIFILTVLTLAPKITKLLGKTGINIVMRIMGLIMASLGVEFIAKGTLALFPGLS